jgi:2-keto-4-pentenoate hydratase/2-oxohepta-3-ene-1,7-dioic acid hydratase in catechol pathway
MKLLRYEESGQPRLGVLVGEAILPLDGLGYATMLELIEAGPAALDAVRACISSATDGIPLSGVKLLAPVEMPGKYLAIGMNYAKHLEEADKLGVSYSKGNSAQTWFNKQTTCISGPYDAIDPGVTEKLDYECELGFVIGRRAKYVTAADALNYIFGYFVANDVSARDWQFHTSTVTMGKSFDTHGPIGPWIVTADEIPDPQSLGLRTFVNGVKRQESNTEYMVHKIADQIEYLSTAFTLLPGDLIATGTPEGVGIGMDPQTFLQPGDVVRCEIDGIGAIENRVARV